MTAIVGIVHNTRVLLGGDSAGVSGLRTRVPCGVCAETVTGWNTSPDDQPLAAPCGHTAQQILDQGARMARVEFGEHARTTTGTSGRRLPDADPI